MTLRNLKVLVPIDFSEPSIHALRYAVQLVQTAGGQITLLYVGVIPRIYDGSLAATAPIEGGSGGPPTLNMHNHLLEMHQQILREQEHLLARTARQEIPAAMRHDVVIREGHPSQEILGQLVDGGYDLAVMGTRGNTGLKRVLLGSVTERVLRDSPAPVVVTH